jgi:hypothetical protein
MPLCIVVMVPAGDDKSLIFLRKSIFVFCGYALAVAFQAECWKGRSRISVVARETQPHLAAMRYTYNN